MILASNLVANLQDLINRYGDLPLIYSTDSEGNNYKKVIYDANAEKVDNLDKNDLDVMTYESETEINCFLIN